jgi:hypothetical protein
MRTVALALLVGGCAMTHSGEPDAGSAEPVGGACLPENMPPGGFDGREIYIETNHEDCGAPGAPGICIVYQLEGDPHETGCADCPTEADVAARVFCSCRCSGDPEPVCACPSGFSCAEDLALGDGYCVRDGL